jgi:hypothetical protein
MNKSLPRAVTLDLALEFVNAERERCAALIPSKEVYPYMNFLLMQPTATVH